jgi:putative transcription factor
MQCEMCGSQTQVLLKTNIEGSVLNVCRECASFGKIVGEIRPQPRRSKKKQEAKAAPSRPQAREEQEPIYMIVPGFARKIKNARERKGLDQKKFAKKINEKDSLIHKLETAALEPSIKLARKIEKFLGITLVQEYKDETVATSRGSAKQVTIGDMIRIRKR